jgi:hypothetical protein
MIPSSLINTLYQVMWKKMKKEDLLLLGLEKESKRNSPLLLLCAVCVSIKERGQPPSCEPVVPMAPGVLFPFK